MGEISPVTAAESAGYVWQLSVKNCPAYCGGTAGYGFSAGKKGESLWNMRMNK